MSWFDGKPKGESDGDRGRVTRESHPLDGLKGRAREKAAEKMSRDILRRAGRDGDAWGDEYGAGKLTKDQRKSQERHIPMTERKGSKLGRSLWG